MNNSKFYYSNFFSDPGILQEFLKDFENIWEALPEINNFLVEFEKVYKDLGYRKDGDIYIGEGAEIDRSSRIDGKAIIGKNCTLGHASYLRGGVILGDGVHVGHAVEVKHSIIMSGTALAHLSYIGDSILGSKINLSGGTIVANWRFDRKDIFVKEGDNAYPTNMEKFGSILGDDCFIGVNAVLNPGTVLAKECLVFPLTSVKGAHLTKEVIR